jgi:hypothetical protein
MPHAAFSLVEYTKHTPACLVDAPPTDPLCGCGLKEAAEANQRLLEAVQKFLNAWPNDDREVEEAMEVMGELVEND